MKIKLTLPTAKIPQRANPTDAGADLFSTVNTWIIPHGHEFIDFGIQLEIPEYFCGMIFARSGLGSKNGIRPRNGTGIIDSKYRGNIGMMVENHSNVPFEIKIGDRIAQLLIIPVSPVEFQIVDELCMVDDRKGGWGSTGIK